MSGDLTGLCLYIQSCTFNKPLHFRSLFNFSTKLFIITEQFRYLDLHCIKALKRFLSFSGPRQLPRAFVPLPKHRWLSQLGKEKEKFHPNGLSLPQNRLSEKARQNRWEFKSEIRQLKRHETTTMGTWILNIGIPNILKFSFPMFQKQDSCYFVLFSNGNQKLNFWLT